MKKYALKNKLYVVCVLVLLLTGCRSNTVQNSNEKQDSFTYEFQEVYALNGVSVQVLFDIQNDSKDEKEDLFTVSLNKQKIKEVYQADIYNTEVLTIKTYLDDEPFKEYEFSGLDNPELATLDFIIREDIDQTKYKEMAFTVYCDEQESFTFAFRFEDINTCI